MIFKKIYLKVLLFLSYIRSSYWLIPFMMVLGAIILAVLATSVDRWLGNKWIFQSEFFLNSQAEGARAVLATIAGSMITIAGVTFSMTLVAVSFALGQIGPRLIRNFMRDRANQFTLGTFIATFLYSILVLRTVLNANTLHGINSFVPHIAIFIAMILATLSIAVLTFFIHHIQKSINISEILGEIGEELINQVEQLDKSSSEQSKEIEMAVNPDFLHPSNCIFSKKYGYVLEVNIESLFKLAIKRECLIEIKSQPGMFVSQTSSLLYVSQILNESDEEICLNSFSIGHERDQGQDIYFLSDEMAEIIARALSPSVNDPFTAISAINWIRCAIETFSRIKIIPSYRYDENKNVRVIYCPITLTQFVERIFGQIRTYVSSDFNTALHMMLVLKEMIQHCTNPTLIQLLQLHASYFHAASIEKLSSKQDKVVISSHFAEIKSLKKEEINAATPVKESGLR